MYTMDISEATIENKNKVVEFAESHPYVLLSAIGILIIIILVMYLKGRGYGVTSIKKTKKTPETEDEEVDVLIESIHDKQK